jgi:hypothetical protein
MAHKIKIFTKSKKLKKEISKLNSLNQSIAMEYSDSMESQVEMFVDDLKAQEYALNCCLKQL